MLRFRLHGVPFPMVSSSDVQKFGFGGGHVKVDNKILTLTVIYILPLCHFPQWHPFWKQ